MHHHCTSNFVQITDIFWFDTAGCKFLNALFVAFWYSFAMQKLCNQCAQNFEIRERDLKFYEKISPTFGGKKYSVPSPTLCPQCRMQRRMAWRSREYFFRPCGLTNKQCLSIYPPDAEVVTYSPEAFFSDDWDGLSLGRDFDFSRPFFEQFHEIYQKAPKNTANARMNENCEYIINAHANKDCYLVDEIDDSRDCVYGYNIQKCTDVVNGFYVRDSQLCYETQQAGNCYGVFFSHNVSDCSDSAFLRNCKNTRNSLFCTNLRRAEYCIFNQQVSKEEFKSAWDDLFDGSFQKIEGARKKFQEFVAMQPLPASIKINTETSSGDYLFHTKDCYNSYNIDHCQDCSFCTDIHYSRDAYDVHIYKGELMYECLHAGPNAYNNIGVILCWFCTDVFYSCELHNSKNMFGCSSLKNKQYCILNKQYTKEEYEALVPKIIEHMQKTGEWGEFFPVRLSPYGYDQTMAAFYWPLEKRDAESQGFHWRDAAQKSVAETSELPDRLQDFTDDMLKMTFQSAESGKSYKIIAKELAFHRKFNIPLPRIAPQERIMNFIKQNSRTLLDRHCAECKAPIQTTLANHVRVLCEECYFRFV